jgi:predicted DNA-binding protein
VTITHRIPSDLRDRLKIAAVRLGRREQDVVVAALGAWLDEHEAGSDRRPQ